MVEEEGHWPWLREGGLPNVGLRTLARSGGVWPRQPSSSGDPRPFWAGPVLADPVRTACFAATRSEKGVQAMPDPPSTHQNRASRLRRWFEPTLLVVTTSGLLVGVGAWAVGAPDTADAVWMATTAVAIVPALAWMVLALWRGRTGVDLIAVLSLGGTLAVHEYLAGALIAVMLASGQALDSAAQRRASHDLRALLEHAPRIAHRRAGVAIENVSADEVRVGDLLLVAPGEVVPVDGRVGSDPALLDESVLTGESAHVERGPGDTVRRGVVNAGTAFELVADARAQESTYAGIVRLAEQAGAERAPVVRLADRYATWFLPLALLLAGAGWLMTGSRSARSPCWWSPRLARCCWRSP